MNIGFRVDASIQIGSGHVYRCLTLANLLRQNGHDCVFVCRQQDGHLMDTIKNQQFPVYALAPTSFIEPCQTESTYQHWLGTSEMQDAVDTVEALNQHDHPHLDWLVVDHYGLSADWEKQLRAQAHHILVIDDLANRSHDADILLDSGLSNPHQAYQQLNQRPVNILLGPQYALLRPEFAQYRQHIRPILQDADRLHVLINLGGVDKDNVTAQILDTLAASPVWSRLASTTIMGSSAPWRDDIMTKVAALGSPHQVCINTSNMAQLMSEHDIAIGAAGSTSWERCCVGLPTIMYCLADNQQGIAQALSDHGAAITLPTNQIDCLPDILTNLNPTTIQHMREQALLITDGLGCQRVCDVLLQGEHP